MQRLRSARGEERDDGENAQQLHAHDWSSLWRCVNPGAPPPLVVRWDPVLRALPCGRSHVSPPGPRPRARPLILA
jgi:hypothetical protein